MTTTPKRPMFRQRHYEAIAEVIRDVQQQYVGPLPVYHVARRLARNALRKGTLIRQPCEVCQTTIGVDAHHNDYSKPLDVRWLCRSHHAAWHKQQNRKALKALVEAGQ